MTLSHTQAFIKRGFSINKHIEIVNLKEQSYISVGILKNYVEYCGSVLEVQIIIDLPVSASCSRQMHAVLKRVTRRKRNTLTV